MNLSEKDIQRIAEAAAEKGVSQAFTKLGIVVEDGHDLQEWRQNFEFLNDWRALCDMSKRRGVGVVVTLMVGAVFSLIVGGIAAWILGLKP